MKLEEITVKEAFDRGFRRVWLDGVEYGVSPPFNQYRKCYELRATVKFKPDRRLVPDQKVIVEVRSE